MKLDFETQKINEIIYTDIDYVKKELIYELLDYHKYKIYLSGSLKALEFSIILFLCCFVVFLFTYDEKVLLINKIIIVFIFLDFLDVGLFKHLIYKKYRVKFTLFDLNELRKEKIIDNE